MLPGGAAAEAGLQAGQLVTAVNGRPVASADALIGAIRAQRGGDTVTLAVTSPTGQARTVQVTLGAQE